MKKLTSFTNKSALNLFTALCFCGVLLGQAPQKLNYQAVIRDASGEVITNENINLTIAVVEGDPNGTEVFSETHNTNTNSLGLVSLAIGSENPSAFSSINWAGGAYFIKVSINGTELGTSQLLSVPYALHAKHAENVDDADADPTNEVQTLTLVGSELSISGGNSILLPSSELDLDGDPENELQEISLTGTNLSISGGNTISLSSLQSSTEQQTLNISGHQLSITNGNTVTLPDNINDADANPSNEIQDLTLSGTNLSIEHGNSVDLSPLQDGYEANTDNQTLSVSGSELSISNGNSVTLPDNENLWTQTGNNISYTTGDVHVENDFFANNLSVGSSTNVKIIEFMELTGTTSATSNTISVALPSGYTSGNCRLLSLDIFWANAASFPTPITYSYRYSLGYTDGGKTLWARLTYSMYVIYPSGFQHGLYIHYPDNLMNRTFRAILMKVD